MGAGGSPLLPYFFFSLALANDVIRRVANRRDTTYAKDIRCMFIYAFGTHSHTQHCQLTCCVPGTPWILTRLAIGSKVLGSVLEQQGLNFLSIFFISVTYIIIECVQCCVVCGEGIPPVLRIHPFTTQPNPTRHTTTQHNGVERSRTTHTQKVFASST